MENKKSKIVIGMVAGILILGAAAFIGGRLLNNKSAGLGGVLNFGNNSTSMTSVEIEPSPLLPKTDALVFGTFNERKDKTIIVQTFSADSASGGGVAVSITGDDGSGEISTDFAGDDGPKVEIVTTKDTIIYKDVTEFDFDGNATEITQQQLEPGSLDDLTKSSMLTVWGRKVGDRTIADVIVINDPMNITIQ